jgi:hypothetical protein
MNVKLYVNWEEEEIILPMAFQKLCELKKNELEADDDFLDSWFNHEKRLSAAEVFRMSQEELDALKKEYSMYCSESAEIILIENDNWQEREIDI